MGICHAYAPDGRCISLLKILMTNFCIFDCKYCINRSSSNVERARFTPREIVDLTLNFYKRNYIEGLFLSSGIIQSPDYTMECLVETARMLREDRGFKGYIHLKTIAEADPLLIEQAGLYADRLSVNIELPTDAGLTEYAPQKTGRTIRKTMATVRMKLDEDRDSAKNRKSSQSNNGPRFAPGGQSTQMIVGADGSSDADIINTSSSLYSGYKMRRVYYSAFSPIPDASGDLPPVAPPLVREHRLYQADWLFRFYRFTPEEIISTADSGMLDLEIDPKLAWALKNRHWFPVDVNRAPRHLLMRIPGLGSIGAGRILSARRLTRLGLGDLSKISASLKKMLPFIEASDWTPGSLTDTENLRARFTPPPEQLSLL